jgi:hypothetical protein
MSFVLASGSASRRAILENAGLVFDTDPADVDEDALKHGHDGDLSALALRLAEAKALAVSARRPGEPLQPSKTTAGKAIDSMSGIRSFSSKIPPLAQFTSLIPFLILPAFFRIFRIADTI